MSDWNTAEEHVDRALELFRRGRLGEAEQAMRIALSISPDRGDWQFNLALTLDALGKNEEALVWYQMAAKALPEELEVVASAGIALVKFESFDDGLRLLEDACRLDSSCEEAWAHRIDALARSNRYEEAEAIYFLAQQYLEDYPNCLYAMGEALFENGLTERAIWCFREAARQEPTLPRVRARLATALAASGRSHRAVRMFLQELREHPGSMETLLDFGDLLTELGRYGEAEEKFKRMLEINPAETRAHRRLAEIAMHRGYFEEAVSEFELVQSLAPDEENIILPLASALLATKRTRETRILLVDFTEKILEGHQKELENRERDELLQLVDLLLKCGLPGLAGDLCDKQLVTAPEDIDILRRLAFAAFDRGDRRTGDRVSRKLLRLDPTLCTVHENLVLSAIRARKPALAWARIQRGLNRFPDHEALRRLRTLVLLRRIPGLISRMTRQNTPHV
jgi:tetratricopeptide (TPR) repeat protein